MQALFLTILKLQDKETQTWYDGYRFNKDDHIYCPNSIMELVSRKRFDSYWTKTETYESLRDYIDLDYLGLKGSIIDMLGGNHCRIPNEEVRKEFIRAVRGGRQACNFLRKGS